MASQQHECSPPPADYAGEEFDCECGRRFWAAFVGKNPDGSERLAWHVFELKEPSHPFERYRERRTDS